MMKIKNELKIMGATPFLISATLAVLYTLVAVFSGELLDLSCAGFEVIFPFYAAIAVGEWGKIKADDNFEVIAAQTNSLFQWIATRALTVFAIVSLFAAVAMVSVVLLRDEMPLCELALTYFAPAFFLSSLGALFNLCLPAEHSTALLCGLIWLSTMLLQAALRFPGVEYVYLFIRYAGDPNGIWIYNKLILIAASLILWGILYFLCKRNPRK